MKPEGINESAEPPSILLTHRKNFSRAGRKCSGKEVVWVSNDEDESNVPAFGRHAFFRGVRAAAEPEASLVNGQPDDKAASGVFKTIGFHGAEGSLIMVNCFGPVRDGQPRFNSRIDIAMHELNIANLHGTDTVKLRTWDHALACPIALYPLTLQYQVPLSEAVSIFRQSLVPVTEVSLLSAPGTGRSPLTHP